MRLKRRVTENRLKEYEEFLYEEEKSPATIKKYIGDIHKLMEYAKDREITKKVMREYKQYLMEVKQYKERSINSFLVAANNFLQFMGWQDAIVKLNKIQNDVFCMENKYLTKEEYIKLVKTAQEEGKKQLAMILQTIAATGIRISELQYVTKEAVQRGCLEIRNKGKSRKIPIPLKLKVVLEKYMKEQGIEKGMIFLTSGGKMVDRSNIWRGMKKLCEKAGIDEEKVFPHNLRHLFAQCFYEVEKDIAKLADMLGHSRIETTRIYIMTTGAEHKRQMEQMEMVLGWRTGTT